MREGLEKALQLKKEFNNKKYKFFPKLTRYIEIRWTSLINLLNNCSNNGLFYMDFICINIKIHKTKKRNQNYKFSFNTIDPRRFRVFY